MHYFRVKRVYGVVRECDKAELVKHKFRFESWRVLSVSGG